MVSIVIQPENAGAKIQPCICLTQVSSSLLLLPCRSHYINVTTLPGTFSGYFLGVMLIDSGFSFAFPKIFTTRVCC